MIHFVVGLCSFQIYLMIQLTFSIECRMLSDISLQISFISKSSFWSRVRWFRIFKLSFYFKIDGFRYRFTPSSFSQKSFSHCNSHLRRNQFVSSTITSQLHRIAPHLLNGVFSSLYISPIYSSFVHRSSTYFQMGESFYI